MALTDSGLDLLVSFAVNVVIAIFFLLSFELMRYWYPFLYNRRRTLEVLRPEPWDLGSTDGGASGPRIANDLKFGVRLSEPNSEGVSATDQARVVARETTGFLRWFQPTFGHNEEWILRHRGRDAVMYLRFVSTMVWLLASLAVLLFIVIVPANATGSNKDLPPGDPRRVEGLLIISIANVPTDSPILWLHAIMVLVVTCMACLAVYRLQVKYLELQSDVDKANRFANRTLFIRGVTFSDADGPDGRFDFVKPLVQAVAAAEGVVQSAAKTVRRSVGAAVSDEPVTESTTAMSLSSTANETAAAVEPDDARRLGSIAGGPAQSSIAVAEGDATASLGAELAAEPSVPPERSRWQVLEDFLLWRFRQILSSDEDVVQVHLMRADPRLTQLWIKERRHVRTLRRAVFRVAPDILEEAAHREEELLALDAAAAAAAATQDGLSGVANTTDVVFETEEEPEAASKALWLAEKRASEADQAEVAEAEAEEKEIAEMEKQASGTERSCCSPKGAAAALGWTDEDRKRQLVDHIAKARLRLRRVRDAIRAQQSSVPTRLTGTACIVFRSPNAVQACVRKRKALGTWQVFRPSNRWDVNWDWLHVKSFEQVSRQLLAIAAVCFMLFFWSLAVTFVQGLGNLRQLAETPAFGWLIPILDFLGPGVEALLNAYLPSLLLVLLLSLVPPILRRLTAREGHVTNLATEQSILVRFFSFLVINVFLVSTIAGSVMNVVKDILEGERIGDLLATSLPSQGPFFIEYLMVKTCYVAMDLLRPHILLFFALRAVGRSSATNDFVIEYRSTLDYGPRFGWDLLVVVVALTFSIMYPFILIFATTYFAVVAVVHRHNIIFLHRPRIELQSQLWPTVMACLFWAILIFLWTMIGWFALSSSPAMIFPLLGTAVMLFVWYKARQLKPGATDPVLAFKRWWASGERQALILPEYSRCRSSSNPDGGDWEATFSDDDDYDGLTDHGRRTAAEAERLYFVQPTMMPPASELCDDPYNKLRPQL